MTTFFLRKKYISKWLGGISVGLIFLFVLYSAFLSQSMVRGVYTSFYIVVTENMHVEVGAEFSKLEGGAGYLMRVDGRECAVLSVYLKESDAKRVCAAVAQTGTNAKFLPIMVKRLYFQGKERKKADVYLSALSILKGYLTVLQESISLLDKGATQERVKWFIASLRQQMGYSARNYKTKYPAYAQLCEEISEDFLKLEKSVLYARDLRYISCKIVEGYLRLCQQFEL